jgi:hypothetical protein
MAAKSMSFPWMTAAWRYTSVVATRGGYSGCPGNTLARRRVIEPLIGKRVPGAKVSVSSGPMIPRGAEKA